MSLNRQVLVINACYQPVNIVSARRAMKLLFKGAAVVEEVSPYTIRTAKISIPIPSVLRLLSYRRVPRLANAMSRRDVLIRDRFSCQYCNTKLPAHKLTLDHVLPKSRGGASTWENLVTACLKCNNIKGDRTPQEAGLVLAKQPRQMTVHMKHRMLASDPAWDKFLFA